MKIDRRHSNSGRFPFTEAKPGCREKLIRARLDSGRSQEEMAKLLGCTQEQYSRMENGNRAGKKYWLGICDVFGIDPDDIYNFMEPCNDEAQVDNLIKTKWF